jgi:adenylate kinase family enzyme
MKAVSELKPGEIIRENGVAFTVRQVLNTDEKTLIIFEDMPATNENMEAYGSLLKKAKELKKNGKAEV